jgi:hypothetical protein
MTLIFMFNFSLQVKCDFVSKYIPSNNMLISYSCLTFIYFYTYLSMVWFLRVMYKNFISGSVNI